MFFSNSAAPQSVVGSAAESDKSFAAFWPRPQVPLVTAGEMVGGTWWKVVEGGVTWWNVVERGVTWWNMVELSSLQLRPEKRELYQLLTGDALGFRHIQQELLFGSDVMS